MLKIMFSLMVGVVSVCVSSAYAEETESLECGKGIAYRPGGSTVVEARFAFRTELDILLTSCEVQKKLAPIESGNYYIRSFVHKNNVSVLMYEVIDFTDSSKPTEYVCTLTQILSYAPGEGDFASEKMTEDVTQTCTEPVLAK